MTGEVVGRERVTGGVVGEMEGDRGWLGRRRVTGGAAGETEGDMRGGRGDGG